MQQIQGADPRFRQPHTVPSPAFSTPSAACGGAVPWVVLWLVVFAGCLTPAALNGHPLVFGDLLDYVRAARDLRPTHERAFGYGAFLRATGGLVSFWLPTAVQAGLAATLVVRLVSLEGWTWSARRQPLLLAALTALLLAGHLPWEASFVMPDVFAGITVLALLLLSEHWARLPLRERLGGAGVLGGAATVHLTHPPLMLGLAFAAGAVGFLLPMAVPRLSAALLPARRAAALALAAAAFGWGALVVANLVTYREATPASGGPVFLFARLQADTDAPRILRAPCQAGAGFAICRHLDRMEADRPSADEFLWDLGQKAPFLPELGWMVGFHAEARALNPLLLREGWRDWLAASAGRTAAQLVEFGLGDGMDREGSDWMTQGLPDFGMAEKAAAIASTKQAADRLVPLMPRRLADGLAAAGLLALLGLIALGLWRGQAEVWWPALLFLVAWGGNAVLVALGGEVHGRYGARLVWVAPLLAGVLALRLAALTRADRGQRPVRRRAHGGKAAFKVGGADGPTVPTM